VEQKTSRQDYVKRIREREAAEKKRKEKWSKELKQKMNSNNTPIFNSTQNYNPNNYTYASGSITTTNTGIGAISSTSIADAKITIDGGENGSMRVDVPLLVNGRDVMKEIDEMRDALLLLKRDVDMESKYPKLKKIKDEYEAALSKYKTFDAIKESK
jgi:hypothetical protein